MASPALFASSSTSTAVRGARLSGARFTSFSSVAGAVLALQVPSGLQLNTSSTLIDDDTSSIETWQGDLPPTSSTLTAGPAPLSSSSLSASPTSIHSASSASSFISNGSTIASSSSSSSGTSLSSSPSSTSSSTCSSSSSRYRRNRNKRPTRVSPPAAVVDPLRNSIPFPRIAITPSLLRRGTYRNPSPLPSCITLTLSSPSCPMQRMASPPPVAQPPRNSPTTVLLRPAAPTSFLHTTFAPAMYNDLCQVAEAPSKGVPLAWRRQRKASFFRPL